jgi:hypothetical protein
MHKLLVGHDCTTAQRRGWRAVKNGDLIRQAESEFELFITADQNIRYQQNLSGRNIAILELSTNDIGRIRAASELICSTIAGLNRGEFRQLQIP